MGELALKGQLPEQTYKHLATDFQLEGTTNKVINKKCLTATKTIGFYHDVFLLRTLRVIAETLTHSDRRSIPS